MRKVLLLLLFLSGVIQAQVTINGTTVRLGGMFVKNAQTGTYQVLAADFTAYKTITVASGTFTITLVASGAQPLNGKYVRIINYGSGVVTVARSGQNINGGTSSLTIPAGSAIAPTGALIVSDGTNYFAALFGGGATIASTTKVIVGDNAGNGVAASGTGSDCIHVDAGSAPCGTSTELVSSVASTVLTVAQGKVNYIVAGVPTTYTMGAGTITKTGGTDTGTFLIYADYNAGTPVLRCGYGAGITIGNYTVSSGFSGSTCSGSITAFPADSIPVASVDISSGTLQTPTSKLAIYSRDPVLAGAGLVKSGNTLSLDASAFIAQTDGATITWAIASTLNANASVTLGGNRTLNITNPVIGGNYVLRVTQDGTGSRTLTLGSGCTWKIIGGGSGAITLSTAAASVDVLAFTYDGTNCLASLGKNYN